MIKCKQAMESSACGQGVLLLGMWGKGKLQGCMHRTFPGL